MNIDCERGEDGNCTQCGDPVPLRHHRYCSKGPMGKAKPGPCIHLGEPTGANALIKCAGCCGNVRKKVAVSACAVHGECLPTREAVEDVKGRKWAGCVGCKSRTEAEQPGE